MHARGTDGCFDLGHPITARRINSDVETELLRPLELFRRARGPDDRRSCYARDLQRRGSHSAPHRVNEHCFAGAKYQTIEERVVRCEKGLGNRGSVLPRHPFGSRHRLSLVHAQVLSVGTASDDPHHPVANFPECG